MATEPHGPGGVALRAWLHGAGTNIPEFAEHIGGGGIHQHIDFAIGADRVHHMRMTCGERDKRHNRALAALIELSTDGAVPRTIWYPSDDADATSDEGDA